MWLAVARAMATAINTIIQTLQPYACRPLAGDYVNYWASSFRSCGEKRLFYPEATLNRDRFVSVTLCATISLHCIDDSATLQSHKAVNSMGSGDRLAYLWGLQPSSYETWVKLLWGQYTLWDCNNPRVHHTVSFFSNYSPLLFPRTCFTICKMGMTILIRVRIWAHVKCKVLLTNSSWHSDPEDTLTPSFALSSTNDRMATKGHMKRWEAQRGTGKATQ